jgi:hypothetical protein
VQVAPFGLDVYQFLFLWGLTTVTIIVKDSVFSAFIATSSTASTDRSYPITFSTIYFHLWFGLFVCLDCILMLQKALQDIAIRLSTAILIASSIASAIHISLEIRDFFLST